MPARVHWFGEFESLPMKWSTALEILVEIVNVLYQSLVEMIRQTDRFPHSEVQFCIIKSRIVHIWLTSSPNWSSVFCFQHTVDEAKLQRLHEKAMFIESFSTLFPHFVSNVHRSSRLPTFQYSNKIFYPTVSSWKNFFFT